MKTEPFPHRSRAFSLIEILVAMVILTLITSLLAVVASKASDIWRSTEAGNQHRATGRALLQFIARDLEMARLQTPYPRANNANLRFIANAPSLIPEKYLNPHAAFWQAPVAINQSRGDLATIGYFVRWNIITQLNQPNVAKAQLCRFLVDPAETANYHIYSMDVNGTPAHWLDATTIETVASASASYEYRGWFADNVIALWLRCLDSEGNPILGSADPNELYHFDSNEGYVNPLTGQAHQAPTLPASIEIALITVDAATAKRIKSPIVAAPNSPVNFWKDKTTPGSLAHFVDSLPSEIQPGVQVFSTRVSLKNARP